MARSFQHATVGAVVCIELGDGSRTYAQILPHCDYAFFDARTDAALGASEVVERPLLFRAAVSKWGVTSKRWLKVGKAPLGSGFEQARPMFIQDHGDPNSLFIYVDGEGVRGATPAECEGLERCAVWEPEHVEDRLRAHYAGVADTWSDSLKLEAV